MDERQVRTLYLYEYLLGHSARAAADNINTALGAGSTSHATVSRWFDRFKSGDRSLESQSRSGRPSAFNDDDLRRELQSNPDATTRELAEALNCSHHAVEYHLHELGYRKVLARWVPHILTDASRAVRVAICQSLLLRPRRKDFLSVLVTGDESWIHYENDTRRAFWLPREETPPTQPKLNQKNRLKVLLCCFWDAQGMLFHELLHNETINADKYLTQLAKLSAAIKKKRRRRVNVVLLHDNARPHVASAVRQQLENWGWETIPHPPYSPDLAPSDYHLFRALKQYLRGKKFNDFSSIEADLNNFFEAQPSEFWAKGIQTLPDRWQEVLDANGDYIID